MAWLAPAIMFLAVFMVLPLFDVIRLSFTTASIIEPEYSYTLSSYAKVFGDKDFLWSLSITFIFVAANCVLQIPLGLLIALAVHAGRDRNVHGSIVARTAVLTAWIIPGVLVGILWKTLLSSASSGIINHFVQSMGMERIPFLLDPLYAVISIIAANVWGGAAFCMILQYAGLQRIPAELYEVSRVDGARACRAGGHDVGRAQSRRHDRRRRARFHARLSHLRGPAATPGRIPADAAPRRRR